MKKTVCRLVGLTLALTTALTSFTVSVGAVSDTEQAPLAPEDPTASLPPAWAQLSAPDDSEDRAAVSVAQGPESASNQDNPLTKVEPLILDELAAVSRTDFFVWMTEKANLRPAYRLNTNEEKGRFVFRTLRQTANRTQRALRAYLDQQVVDYRPFYIANKILVRGGNQTLLLAIASRPDVARITANHQYQLEEPFINPSPPPHILAVEPNISFVNADSVWALGYTGQGIVLAGNDTGLDWDHPALINQYRGWDGITADHNYNWWDATGTYPIAPNDGHGHGTHTTGTMVGDDGGANQIGMAPGAQTIHCKNMTDGGSGSDATFSECLEWDLAPWDLSGLNPDPDLAPDAINNSWGYWGGGAPQFKDEIAALQAAGILVEVSAGNEGPFCGTLRSPGDYAEVLTTGSVNHAGGTLPGTLTDFSSRGPSSLDSGYFPDVMAPGENIRSSVPGGGYQGGWSGTSMAGPHTTGLIGLMWSANPGLRGMISETMEIILDTAIPLTGQTGSSCGGDYTEGPNNDWGYGTIDALVAVEQALLFGGTGTLEGTVTDGALTAVPDATVKATLSPTLTWQTASDALGGYSMVVFTGTHTVDAYKYGHIPARITGVSVVSGTTTTLDITLPVASNYAVSGTVSDSVTGDPLWATISIAGDPVDPPTTTMQTDRFTGYYSLTLAAGITYTFDVTALLHNNAVRTIGPLMGDTTENFALVATTTDGVIAGWVRNKYTDNPIGNATVQVDGGPSATTNAEGYYQTTPIAPGYYTATASANLFSSVTITDIEVVQSNIGWAGFYLPTPHIEVDPAALSYTLELGDQFTQTPGLVISNTGEGELEFELREQDEGFGSPLQVTDLHVQMPATQLSDNPMAKDGPRRRRGRDAYESVIEGVRIAASTYEVLILTPDVGSGGGNVDSLLAALAPFSDLNVTVWDPDADGEPDVADLLPYDVVIVGNDILWNNMDKATVGNNLADYIDQGGKVIEGLYSQSFDEWGFAGRYMTDGYSPFTPATTDNWNPDTMNVLAPAHSVMDGVSSVNDNWGHQDPGLQSGADLLAEWTSSGYHYIAVNDNVVALNQLLHHAADWTGDVGIILHNAIVWLSSGGDAPWLSESPVTGTVAVSGLVGIDIGWWADVPEVDQPGAYHASLRIKSNDPANQNLALPVTMTVTPPTTWGKLTGIVSSTGHCDVNPYPIKGAEVYLEGSGGYTFTLETDAAGAYQRWLDSAESPYTVTVSYPEHPTTTVSVVVNGGVTKTQNFTLRWAQPCVSVEPPGISATLDMGLSTTLPMSISNSGAVSLEFELQEQDQGFHIAMLAAGTAPKPRERSNNYDPSATTTEGILAPGGSEPLNILGAGDVLAQWSSGLALPWGAGYSFDEDAIWLSNPAAGGGDDLNHEFETDGTPTGRTVNSTFGGYWAGDVAYNPNTGMFWQVNIGGDNCMHEWDPASGPTGNSICNPTWTWTSQRGLAYDPTDDTFFIGGWNDTNVYHIDNTGAVIEQWPLSLSVSGLAYNSEAGILFIIENSTTDAISVLDVSSGTVIDSLTVAGFGSYAGAGLAIDCDGNLWAANQGDANAYLVDSGVPANLCAADVPWLFEEPITGTVPADSGLVPIDVTLDAAYVAQPGEYYATLNVTSDDPVNDRIGIPVTMTVELPATYGKLEGTVSSLGYCDVSTTTLEGAEVRIEGSPLVLTTDISGTYSAWVDQGSYTVTVSAAEHLTDTAEVTITTGMTTTQDFDLRWLKPCISVAPPGISTALDMGLSTTLPMSITNSGVAPTAFQIVEADRGQHVLGVVGGGPDPFGYIFADSNEPSGPIYDWIEIAPPAGGSGIPVGLNGIDDGHFWALALPFPFNFYGTDYTQLAVASNGTVYFEDAYLGLGNTPIPGPNSYGVDTFIAHFWDDLYVTPGEVYYLAQDDMFIIEYYQVSGCCATPDPATWEVILFANGSVLFQYQDTDFDDSYYDYGASATVGIQDIQVDPMMGLQYSYDMPALSDGLAICFAYPGNSPDCAPGEVPWLTEDPVTGTLAADTGIQPVDVTFDASVPEITQPGEYYATLNVNSDDPVNDRIGIPVTMTVNVPATYGKLEGTVSSLGYCDVSTTTLEGAEVRIEGSPLVLTTDISGTYSVWLDQGSYTVTVSAAEHLTDTDTVVITAGMTTTHDANLRWAQPCVSVEPPSISATLDMGLSTTLPMSISNSGAVALEFEISEADRGSVLLRAMSRSLPPSPDHSGLNSNQVSEFPALSTAPWQLIGTGALLIQDVPAWGYNAIETILTDNSIPYDVINSSQIATTDFTPYKLVIIPSVQGSAYNAAFNADLGKFEGFIDAGGLVLMSFCEQISFAPYRAIPFGGTNDYGEEDWNYIVDPAHPIFAGVPNPYSGDWASHSYLTDPLPDDRVLVTGGGAPGGNVIMIERDHGAGMLVAGGQTFEWGWDDGQGAGTILENMIPYYYFNWVGGGDVPWLFEDPISGTVPADGGLASVDVTLDTAYVAQPGEYHATLNVNSDDPVNSRIGIPVTMTVELPATYGKLEGTVFSLGYCDVSTTTLEGAEVRIENGTTVTLTTDVSGTHSVWLDQGSYTVTVSAAEHLTDTGTAIITAGMTATHDANLRWAHPCISVEPPSISTTLDMGLSTTLPMSISNRGAVSLDFGLQEQDRGFSPLVLVRGYGEWLHRSETGVPMRTNEGSTALAYPSAYRWQPAGFPSALNVLIYADDFIHTAPNTFVDQALQALGIPYTAHYDGDFAGFAADLSGGGPWDLVIFENNNYDSGGTSFPEMLAYIQSGGKLAAEIWTMLWDNADPLYTEMGVSYANNDLAAPPVYWWDPAHSIFSVPESAPPWLTRSCPAAISCGQYLDPVAGASDALAGYTTPGPDGGQAALILRDDGHAVYKGFADITTNANDDGDGTLDGVELWENIIYGLLYGFGGDVPWLFEDPTSGTVPADGGLALIDVTLDAAYVAQPGEYHATLNVNSDDPVKDRIGIPVTMTVELPATYGKLEGTVFGLGYCDVSTTALEGAEVRIEGSPLVLTTDISGTYSVWLDQGSYTVTVSAAEHLTDTDTVVITAGMTTTHDVNLRWAQPCVSVEPPSISATLDMGLSTTLPMSISNSGAASLAFEIRDQQIYFADDFEAGLGNWVLTGLWNLEDESDTCGSQVAPFPSPSSSAYYGIDGVCTYDNGSANSGELTLAVPVALPVSGGATLSFWSYEETECDGNCAWDDRHIEISTNGGGTWIPLGEGDTEGVWHQRTFDLTPYEGSSVLIRFRFDTIDDMMNDYFGWMIDDMVIFGGDVPWLFENPISGTVPADGGLAPVDVTLDAAYVAQPGEYHATLEVNSDDPVNDRVGIPVTMTVELPATYGKLEGTVSSLGYCDVNTATLHGAEVRIEGSPLVLTTDISGTYSAWLDQGSYTVTVSAADHLTDTGTVTITAGMTTTHDFALHWMQPCIGVAPTDFISITAVYSQPVTYTLSISNQGYAPLDFEIREFETGPLGGIPQQRIYRQMPAAEGVDPLIYEQTVASPDGKVDFFIAFRETADLTPAYSMRWNDRGHFVVEALRATAERSQARVRAWLDKRSIAHTSYWINNTLFVHADETTLNALAAFPEISGFMANRIYQIMPMEVPEPPSGSEILAPAYPWNITFPGADQVHAGFGVRGEGVVIGGMDTGVDYEHIGLVSNYRGNLGGGSFDHTYSWHDPGADECGGEPCDTDTHGTATMGIMAGDDDPSLPGAAWIGMAPNAKWIHCLGCPAGSCPASDTTECAQWFLAPGGDPDMRPHVVNHSWGSWSPDLCDSWYAPQLQAYRAADILPAFAAGNVGDWVVPPHCSSSTPPANTVDAGGNPLAFASGAHGSDGSLDYYSSGGPNACNPDRLFPDLVSPGSGSCTTYPGNLYQCTFGGTSSASPHTAGCAALVRQANPSLTVAEVEQALRDAANDVDDIACGGDADWNNKYGEGHLNCYAAVELVFGSDLPWVWEDPVTGTVSAPEVLDIDVIFQCSEPGSDQEGTLRILSNDPHASSIDVPIVVHCKLPIGVKWDKTINDELWHDGITVTVETSDTIEVVDRVWVTSTEAVTFTLVETWTESLDLIDWVNDIGDVVITVDSLTWDVAGVPPNTWYVITKTFHVLSGTWDTDTITETLWVEGASPQLPNRVIHFNHLYHGVTLEPPSDAQAGGPGQTVTYTLRVTNTGNCTDAFAMSRLGTGWMTSFSPTGFSLDAGAGQDVEVYVVVPGMAGPGDQDVAVVEVTGTGVVGTGVLTTTASVPDIAVNPLAISTTLGSGYATTFTLTISNTGTADLVWNLVETPAREWLDESPTSSTVIPSDAIDVEVVFEASGLDGGTYTTTLQVASNDPDEDPTNVSVTLVVTTSCVDIAGADFSVTPSTPQAGQAITLTGSVAHGTLPVTYTWDFGDGSSLTTGNPVTHTYGLSSTYRVVMTATNGCPSQDVASHDIFAAGEPNITVNPLSLSATLNPGDTATRTLTIGNVSTATANLNWGLAESPARTWLSEAPTAGTVPPSGSTGITVTFDATGLSPGVYTTTLRVTSDDQDEPQVDVSVALTVTTGCVPVDGANFDFAPANPSVGQMVVFTGTVTQGTEPITYTWNFDDGSGVQTGNPITHTFPLVDTVHAYTVTLNVTNICPSQQVVERTVVVRLRAIYLPIVLREY